MTRRVRLLVEVDCVVSNADYEDDNLVFDTANYIASIIDQAEDDAEAKLAAGDLFPTSYRLDAEDLTVWTPSRYLGALLAVRQLSRTARGKLREFDRLPAIDRRSLLVARVRRRRAGIYATCPNCGARRKTGDPSIHGLVYDPSVPCPKCDHTGVPPNFPCP